MINDLPVKKAKLTNLQQGVFIISALVTLEKIGLVPLPYSR